MSTPNPRVLGSFDTRVLLGRPNAAAANVAHQHGCSLRVVNQGGFLTADGRPDRIDVDINHVIVTEYPNAVAFPPSDWPKPQTSRARTPRGRRVRLASGASLSAIADRFDTG